MNLQTRPTFGRQFSEPDATSGIIRDTESSNESTLKPIGSAAARFHIRSANTLQYRPTGHIQDDKSQAAEDRRKDDVRRFHESNKSKSLDWRRTRTGHGNTTGMSSETRDLGQHSVRRTESLDRQESSNKITSYTENNQPNSVPWRFQGNNVTRKGDRKVSKDSQTPLRMNQVTLAMEQTGGGQSLPLRLKPRLNQGGIEEDSDLWTQQQHGERSPDETDNKIGFWAREQGHTNTEEVTGNQTILERIEKLFASSSSDSGHLNSDTMNSIIRHRKSSIDSPSGPQSPSDIQPRRPSYTVEKAGTFPRRFSKSEQTLFDNVQEPSTLEIRNDQKDACPGIFSKPKSGMETSGKTFQAFSQGSNDETSKMRSPEFSSWTLERTRGKLSDTDPPSGQRPHAQMMVLSTCIDGGSKISTSAGFKKEIEKEEPTQPMYPTANLSTVKAEGRRGDGALEKSPSSDSVKNTIHKFEALAQQSQGAPQIIRARRALSVPEQPKPVVHVKKSDSDIDLKFRRVVGNTESVRTNLVSKGDAGTGDPTVQLKPTSEQRLKTYKTSFDIIPTFQQLHEPKPDLHFSIWDENKRTVRNRYTDEPDLAIVPRTGLSNTGTMEKKARNPTFQPTVSHQSNVNRLVKQHSIHKNMDDNNDNDDDDDTPTNSPDRSPLTINMQSNTIKPQTSAHISNRSDLGVSTSANGTYPKVISNPSQSPATNVQTMYSSLNNSNNNNYTTKNDPGTYVTSMARWSSDEEDDYDDEDYDGMDSDSDSGESSVTITSNISQSDRRSFSLSLVELCIYGGVNYKPSDGSVSEDGEDWSPSRSASLSSDISAFSSVTLLSSHELDRLMDDVKNLGDDTLQKYEDVQVVVLHKEVGSGLGFTLAGGVDQNKPVTVHRVIPGGVAAQEGSIYEGAWVLSINGTSLQKSAHWEALRTLRKARSQTMAVVVLQSSNQIETQDTNEAIYRPVNKGRRVYVTLNKSSYDLGFSLEGGVDSSSGDKPLTVQKIFQGGPVNQVFPGDELLAVQGQSLMGMRRIEAWNLIRRLPPGPVEILLHRPHQPR